MLHDVDDHAGHSARRIDAEVEFVAEKYQKGGRREGGGEETLLSQARGSSSPLEPAGVRRNRGSADRSRERGHLPDPLDMRSPALSRKADRSRVRDEAAAHSAFSPYKQRMFLTDFPAATDRKRRD